MQRFFAVLALTLLAAPLSARADMTCKFTDTNGDVYEDTFQGNTLGGVSSALKLNGVEMPAVHACIAFVPAHGNPRMGGAWRCPHGMDEIRLEVYPVFGDNAFGRKLAMRVIRWNGEQLFSTIETFDCK